MLSKLTAVSIGLLLMLGCRSFPATQTPHKRYEFTHRQMGTLFRIILYTSDSTKATLAAELAFNRIDQLNDILSDYKEDSELSRLSISSGTGKKIKVSDDLWQVLQQSVALSQQTNGAFDITVGPYVQLWRRASRQQQLPSEEALQKASQSVGYQYIRFYPDEQMVEITRPGMRLDAGGVGKGYAVDEAMKILQQQGIQSALVDGGGNILVSKAPPGKKGWQVELSSSAGNISVELQQTAVATSGDLYQHIELDGKRYSHILDPRTGLGLTNQIMVTILARDGITADLYSTAVSVLGPQHGLALVERTKHAAAIIAEKTNDTIQTWQSRRMRKLVK
ncbi:FAD:protein FMN transferase [Rhodocytophaga rosea]|uniref:FAD:protein FMN transferase n=1 Tax=Rhodocytophaga rosea TaxID=2704465 RepID=A0A6C0GP11_9BACT|nr:FAD:protein FMN transferase [Rhodocytophaga rosea]QHT69779.1 FAD:protein FMN transferase [Rhodocytophaga rosea]